MFVPPARRYLIASAAALVLLGILWLFGLGRAPIAAAALAGLTAVWFFFAVFFRDPERTPGPDIVSAADGRVRSVALEQDRWRVAVFMNVTDVHVNRFPLDARVESIQDSGHGFRPAYAPEARHNVQRRYLLHTSYGDCEVVQMTGVLARRLVSLVRPGEARSKGARLGMILLGSRVDVTFPARALTPCVAPGDRVQAGHTPIAREHG